MTFKNATNILLRRQGHALLHFVCLVGHDKCSIYRNKQKIKKHLLEAHNFDIVEVGIGR